MGKSSFMKDALVLFAITLIAGVCLGGVYEITKEPIQKANMAAKMGAYQMVFAKAAEFKVSETLSEEVKVSADDLAAAGFGNVTVDDIVEAVDESGAVVGYVVSSTSKDGYSGEISLSVGIDTEGTVTGIEFLGIAETPGLGMNADTPDFKNKFQDKAVERFTVVKGGAAGDAEIDAISGATITTNATVNAVNAALSFVKNYAIQ